MATDYKKIAEEHEKRYGWDAKPRRIYKRLYSDKTHFIYELIQNADDGESQHLELQLDSNKLLVWNDGRRFEEKDVRNICALGSSDKDLTDIGTFGIGFKAVYNYTEYPEIYSDDEHFRIRDFVKPEGIDEVTPEIAKLVNEGKTVFHLPFKDDPHQERDIECLTDRLYNLSKERSLLFLRRLEEVKWGDELNSQAGSYSCHRRQYDKIQDVPENESVELVKLTMSLNGKNKSSESFLVFRKEVHPPRDVIGRLLEQAEDWEEKQRIQQSKEKLQPIEIAFKLQDDRVIAMDDNCVLFAYLPTQKETHLKFLIQARYQTTPARDNIPNPSENPWNKWLVQETANFLPEILEQLKECGLLKPVFFKVIPLRTDPMSGAFIPISEVLRQAMWERAFVPTQNGEYAKAENVFYPHRESLRELVKSDWLYSNSSWLHPEIRDTGEFRRCFMVMREAGVKEIGVSQVLDWLEKQDLNWFEGRCEKWLYSLYVYLNNQKSELKRIKKLPLVRLENGRHVCADEQLVFFPPDTDESREDIKPFLSDLPILQSILLEGDEHNEIEVFLKSVGVKVMRRVDMILKGICPQYLKSVKPSVEENHLHVRYLFKVWNDVSESERNRLKEKISKIPILRAYKGIQREAFDFVLPCNAYLPQAYTGDNDLETYFSSDGDLWFVDDKYLRSKSDTKVWFQFLIAIGTMNTPQITNVKVSGSREECKKRSIAYENSTRPFKDGEFEYVWSRYRYFDGHIVDRSFDGLSEVLARVGNHNEINLPKALWGLLVKVVSSLPSESSGQNTFFHTLFRGIYRWFYRTNRQKSFDATFYRQLKSTAWIPDEQGNLHTPSECFAPTSENRKLLGDSVVYLPADFDISTESTKWLAEKLGVRMEPDTESVLNHLQKFRDDKEVNIKKIEPLYRFLYRTRPRVKIDLSFGSHMVDSIPPWRSKFEKEPLIFIPNSERCWLRADEVFWEDESVVFGKDLGYLTSHYAKDLKSFFTASLAVSESATALDYVDRIQNVKLMKQAANKEIQILYERLWKVMQESNSGSSDRLDVHLNEEFMEDSLIFAPNPERCWWQVNEVFWEDESVVFEDDRGYLKAYYPETLKPFFTALGISERAAPLDYVSGIKEVASTGKAENPEIRKRIKRLFSRVWQSLQEGGDWQETERWKQTLEGRYWLGKKGSEWGFFSRHELVYNDHHEYIADIFKRKLPFWAFDDLFDLARNLEVEGCSQAEIEFNSKGDQDELANLSEKVRNLCPFIHAFLNSPRLCEVHEEGKSAHVLDGLSVCLVEELETVYTLKEVSLTSPNPRPSFLDVTNKEVALWLALEADEDNYALLIGDALQDYFGVKDMGRFVEHLLTKKDQDKVLDHWKRGGLQTELCVSPEADAKEGEEKQSECINLGLSDESKGEDVNAVADGSGVEMPITNRVSETDDENYDSVTDEARKSETHLSSEEGRSSSVDESEVEMPIDSETPEIGKADSNSTSDKPETNTYMPSDINNMDTPDTQVSSKTEDVTSQSTDIKSGPETPKVNESPEIGSGDANSPISRSETSTYTPSKASGTNRSGGHSMSTSSRRRSGGGGHDGSGGGGEGEEHEDLKRDLANNPSRFGNGLTLVKIEYTFGSGDRVDILLKDGSENPVTIEVETGFSSGAGRYVGVWQAVKYQHLAAMEHNLACKQVRSILAAPEIPKDVREKCEELGIEPFEVPD